MTETLIAFRDRYVALWNDPDPAARERAVAELWAEDGVQLVQPPEEVLARATALEMDAAFEVRGHAALCRRVHRAHEEFVAPGRFTFRAVGDPVALRDAVKFRWQMVAADDGAVAAEGLEVLRLTGDGRIREDLQFIER